MSFARAGLNGGNIQSNIVSPFKIDCNFIVDSTNGNGLGIRSLKSNGFVRNVFMHTSATAAANDGYTNPNPAAGYALIQFKQNFNYYLGGYSGFVSPVTGSNISISGSSVLTLGVPYVITAVGTVPATKFTFVTLADSSGSLASKYVTFSDVFGNNYVAYFIVSGVGTAPSLTGSLNGYQAVPVSISTNDTNSTVATALSTAVAALNGTNSFTTGVVGHTLTVTSAAANTNLQFTTYPNVQTSGFTSTGPTFTSLQTDWQSVGLPKGLTPTVGQSFVATATGSALGSGTVKASGISGITSIEVIGDPNQSIASASIATQGGAWLLVQFLGATNSGTTTLIPTAPTNNTVVGMSFYFDNGLVTVDGL